MVSDKYNVTEKKNGAYKKLLRRAGKMLEIGF